MKKFLLKSAGFLFFSVSISTVLIIALEKKLGTLTNSYSLKRQQLETQADSIEVLVLGNSESLHGINPTYFCLNAYNASNLAQSLFYDENITLKYIDKMPRLKYVLIAVTYFSFGYQNIDTKEKWRDYFYAQCWGIKFPEEKSTDLHLHSKILLYTPKMSMIYTLMLFHVNIAKDYYRNGWAKMTYPSDVNDENGNKTATGHNTSYNPERYKNIREKMDTFLYILKQKNITPVFFTPPITLSYYKYVDKDKLKIMYKTISEFCDKYGCRYYDYFIDSRFSNSDFGDCDHLNSKGAEKFSKILNKEILVPFYDSASKRTDTVPKYMAPIK